MSNFAPEKKDKNKEQYMGFWKTFFGGEAAPEEEKKNSSERNFDLLKYDGVKAMRMGQVDYAVKCFTEALKIHDDLETRSFLSRALVSQGQMDEALSQLRVLMEAQPDDVDVVLQAAHVAFLNEDYDTMVSLCEQALEKDADNAMAHFMYGRAERGRGQLIQAVARLTKAITLDGTLGDAHLLRAQVLMQMGQLQEATDDVDWLVEHTEENEDVALLHARLEKTKGNNDVALQLYSKVIDLNPFHVEAYRERGQLRLQLGDRQGAADDMQKVLEINPEEAADVNGEFSAEGIEQKTRQAYSNLNPFGI